MMNTIINEKGITFKELEKNIFDYICRFGQELAKEVLETYDRYLMKNRDKAVYRHKGLRGSTVKTLFGEVSYQRALYRTVREDGSVAISLKHYEAEHFTEAEPIPAQGASCSLDGTGC